MRTSFVLALLALFAVTVPADSRAFASPNSHVRPLSHSMRVLFHHAIERSAIVRSLVEALDESDVIVYLMESPVGKGVGPRGTMRFAHAAGGVRYVVVSIDRWLLSPPDRVAMLAHELQHAVEVAMAPEAVDVQSVAALYRRIGRETSPGRFETDAAVRTSMLIRYELAYESPRW